MFLRMIAIGCLFASSCSFGTQIVKDESLISIDMLPVCNGDAQVKLVYTNVSSGKLLVDPRFVESALFDPFKAGVDLYTPDLKDILLKTTVGGPSHKKLERYAVIAPGESVEHLINFEQLVNEPIDKTQNYIVSFGFASKVITENGDMVFINVSSPFLLKDHTIESGCWQQ